ncbi:hypothetical protein JCM11641_002943 [Rhodosporidiobolus odoratus]
MISSAKPPSSSDETSSQHHQPPVDQKSVPSPPPSPSAAKKPRIRTPSPPAPPPPASPERNKRGRSRSPPPPPTYANNDVYDPEATMSTIQKHRARPTMGTRAKKIHVQPSGGSDGWDLDLVLDVSAWHFKAEQPLVRDRYRDWGLYYPSAMNRGMPGDKNSRRVSDRDRGGFGASYGSSSGGQYRGESSRESRQEAPLWGAMAGGQ